LEVIEWAASLKMANIHNIIKLLLALNCLNIVCNVVEMKSVARRAAIT